MKLIGLTGNIASGKSSVARILVGFGAAHLDADHLVHHLYEPGSEVVAEVVQRFGDEVLAPDGSIDRKALGEIVFRDADALRTLEEIVHPRTGRLILEHVAELRARPDPPPALVVEAVKLIESQRHAMMDQVWFVVAQPKVQKQRLMEQRGLSEAEAEARIRAQASIRDRLHYADVIIENSGSIQTLERQVWDAWRRLMSEEERVDA